MQITAYNVNDAFLNGLWYLKSAGVKADSRNGPVLRAPEPVLTVYKNPEQRMLFDAKRDANPFFHIFEGIWMLAGHNDVKFPARFAKQIAEYSDDGKTLHGAYGFRWRNHWNVDQLSWVIEHLLKHPESRRGVINMWDPAADTQAILLGGKDVPCNTAVYFSAQEDGLDMTVTNRSNDIVWGCYGANAVHMSMLHEFVARAAKFHTGKYNQFSNDFHMYEQHWPLLDHPFAADESYPCGHVPLTSSTTWRRDLQEFEKWLYSPDGMNLSLYVNLVLDPMLIAWDIYKGGDVEDAAKATKAIQDEAVRVACLSWLTRRIK